MEIHLLLPLEIKYDWWNGKGKKYTDTKVFSGIVTIILDNII